MLTAKKLRVEYKTNPLGMDEKQPRFSYELSGTSKRQTACRIVVRDEQGGTVWDSGFMETGRCSQIVYAGKPFERFTRYTWTVQVRDENGRESAPDRENAFFETGFLESPWQGKWISARRSTASMLPPQRIIRRFEVTEKPVKARLYTSAQGLYEAYINGRNVTDDIFTPGWTNYYNRVQYQAYDVTKLIKSGMNMLADLIGDGWFCGRIARNWNGGAVTYGAHASICQELHLWYADGTKEVIASDQTFRQYSGAPSIRMSDIYMGEIYDASEDDIGWKLPTKDSADEGAACVLDQSTQNIEWQSGAPVRRIMVKKPVSIKKRPCGTFLVDFGQNLTGRERITLKNVRRGASIVIRHGEMLNADGSLYTANLRGADAMTIYHTATVKKAVYEPTFTFYGFRYVEISGWPGELKNDQIEAVVIHSALEDTGAFECSNPLINQLFSNIIWGQRSNFLDVPTDCPQRDERMGWTGDTQVFANVATYNMNSAEFYTKWIRDLNFTQTKAGGYKSFVPDPYGYDDGFFGNYATGWADAGIICPDVMLRKYGDLRIIAKYFDRMKRYLFLQVRAAGNSFIVSNATYGDWLNLNDDTSRELLSTSYLAGMAKLLAHHAELLGRKDDETELLALSEKVRDAYRKRFFKDGKLIEKSQTAALLTLHFGLAPEDAYENVCKALVRSIKVTHKLHLSTGFLGTPLLLKVLTQIGEIDLAYDLLQQTTYPGWLYPVTQGATTMWERWNSWNEKTGFGDIRMNSFNHYAYGAVGEWFYETICGIQPLTDTLEHAGFRHFRLAPAFGRSLTEANAVYHSPYGLIASGWKRSGRVIRWHFEVPCGSTAEIVLPGAEKALKAAGIPFCAECGKFVADSGEYDVEVGI